MPAVFSRDSWQVLLVCGMNAENFVLSELRYEELSGEPVEQFFRKGRYKTGMTVSGLRRRG